MNPLHKLRARAYRLGVEVHDIALRRFRKEAKKLRAIDDDGVVRIAAPLPYCKPDLPDDWTPTYGTGSFT